VGFRTLLIILCIVRGGNVARGVGGRAGVRVARRQSRCQSCKRASTRVARRPLSEKINIVLIR
jgi:hypothetical protein